MEKIKVIGRKTNGVTNIGYIDKQVVEKTRASKAGEDLGKAIIGMTRMYSSRTAKRFLRAIVKVLRKEYLCGGNE